MSIQQNRRMLPILVSSFTSSIIAATITNPIEIAKISKQYMMKTCPPHFSLKSYWECHCSNLSKITFKDYWKSLKMVIPQIIASNILYMQTYQKFRQIFNKNNIFSKNTTSLSLLSALSARAITTTLLVPIQSLCVKLSNIQLKYDNYKPSLYGNGFKITLCRDMIYSMLFWGMLQQTRNYMLGSNYRLANKNRYQLIKINMLSGLLTGGVISMITTPLDIIKTRIQSNRVQRYKIIKEIEKIYLKQSFRGLFSGVSYRVVKNGLSAMLYLIFYQFCIQSFSQGHRS